MFDWFKNRGQDRAKAEKLYGAVVTLARTPGFYSQFGVPDTPEGRFEMVALALFMALERTKAIPGAEKLVQSAIETFVTDMDDCMREMGVGDTVVPKRVKRAAAAFYERAADYREPLAANDQKALAAAFERHVYNAAGAIVHADGLAERALRVNAALVSAADRDILSGEALTKASEIAAAA